VNIWLILSLFDQRNVGREVTEAREMQLIEAAKANIQNFTPLYERYALRVYRYMRTRTGSDEDAADLTQQTFMHALHALPRYRAQGVPFAAWLFRIAQYTAYQKQRKERITISWDLLPEGMHPEGEQDPVHVVLHQEQMMRLRKLLGALDTYKRDLLALRFASGLSSAEIAIVVGKSQAAVQKQLTRILQSLKEGYHYDEAL
jgi:RNA polymerase sigma-70 factor, ECF subfamily